MIVGGGMVARAFGPYFSQDPSLVVFASGVSNSGEIRAAAFAREHQLLANTLDGGVPLLYFSSCGVGNTFERDSAYIAHKARMESLVLDTPRGLVVRLPQVVGSNDNPHTLTNFLRDRILCGQPIQLWTRAERNLIDIDDVVMITRELLNCWPSDNRVVDVAFPRSLSMREILEAMESVLGRRATTVEIDKGHPFPVDTTLSNQVASRLGIPFDDGYTVRLLRKYYGDDPNS